MATKGTAGTAGRGGARGGAGGATPRPGQKATGAGGSVAAGAARASGERARRRSTPLLPDPTPPTTGARAAPPAAGAPATESEPVASAPHRPRPVARPVASRATTARSGRRPAAGTPVASRASRRGEPAVTEAGSARLSVVPADASPEPPEPVSTSTSVTPGVVEMLEVAVGAMRSVGQTLGLSSEEVEERVARVIALIRRRVTGDYTVDDFGFDRDFTDSVYLPLLRPLYRSWFRVEVRGIENIPAEGGALIVANHSGTVALDSLMTQVAVHDEHPSHRYLRMLGADLVFSTPVVGDLARKSGATLAANTDAERLLTRGELVGVWPEGFKGVGKPFSERYKLQRFGRGGFVSAALRTSVPIIPCSIVGAEETYPLIGNVKTLARLLGTPYAPVTPTFPWLGPLGLVPLPSKWVIEFGSPLETASLGPAAAEDPMLVFDLTDQVRETIQQTLYSLLMRRRSVFF